MTSKERKVAIITGAASGLGRGIAARLSSDGFLVAIADVNSPAAESVASELNAGRREGVAMAVAMDVTSEQSVRRSVAMVVDRWGRVDVLAANAGVYPGAPIADISSDDWDFVQHVNLRGAFFSLKHVTPYMREQRYGRVVITSSITGAITGFPGWTHYAASKAGLLGMMRSAALELVGDGVTVNAVMPGNVRTPAWNDLPTDYLDKTAKSIPMGRLAEPSDIANGVAFFADARSGYVTGQTLVIDGGQVLPEVPMDSELQ
jgi:3-oxoacyl-[acyl-carrier protein] reductase